VFRNWPWLSTCIAIPRFNSILPLSSFATCLLPSLVPVSYVSHIACSKLQEAHPHFRVLPEPRRVAVICSANVLATQAPRASHSFARCCSSADLPDPSTAHSQACQSNSAVVNIVLLGRTCSIQSRHDQSREHEPGGPHEHAERRLQQLWQQQQCFHIHCKARTFSTRRPLVSSAQERQTPASHLHNMHTLLCTTRTFEATRAIPHKRKAVRVPAMHKVLRAPRPAPAPSTEAPSTRRNFRPPPYWSQGKHDRPSTQRHCPSTQELSLEQCWQRRQDNEAARKHHQPY
jgi:hypothetical protein